MTYRDGDFTVTHFRSTRVNSKSSKCPRKKTLHFKKGILGTHPIYLKLSDNIREPSIYLASKVPERPFPLVPSRRTGNGDVEKKATEEN